MCKNGQENCFLNGGIKKAGQISCYGYQYLVPVEECNEKCDRFITEKDFNDFLEKEREKERKKEKEEKEKNNE